MNRIYVFVNNRNHDNENLTNNIGEKSKYNMCTPAQKLNIYVKIRNIKYLYTIPIVLQVLHIVGDKFTAVITDINGIGLHIKPVCSKITVWTTKITLSNYKNIQNIGYIYLFIQLCEPEEKNILIFNSITLFINIEL